eukprot:2485647-Pyramimonas_sp.AAC.1
MTGESRSLHSSPSTAIAPFQGSSRVFKPGRLRTALQGAVRVCGGVRVPHIAVDDTAHETK